MSCHRNFKIIRYASLKIVYQRIVFINKCNIYICPDCKEDESFIYFNEIVIVEYLIVAYQICTPYSTSFVYSEFNEKITQTK